MAKLILDINCRPGNDCTRISVGFRGLPVGWRKEVSYEIAGPDAPLSLSVANFAVIAALPAAMSLGGTLHCNSEVDADFLENIEDCMEAWCRWRPDLFHRVVISVDKERPPTASSNRKAIMAFSGGLDAAFALHAHKTNLMGRRSLEIESAVLIQGFDLKADDDVAFETARRHAHEILNSYGVRLNTVRTDWRSPFCVDWGATHMLGVASVLQLFRDGFGAAVFADDVTYESQVQGWSNNAITNRMMGSAAYPVRTVGAAHSRTAKAAAVASNPKILEHVRVCWEKPELGANCGTCEKCVRTKMNFYAAGAKSVPALGTPAEKGDILRQPADGNFVYRYSDMLEAGTWSEEDPLRRVVAEKVHQCQLRQISATKDARRRKRGLLARTMRHMPPAFLRAMVWRG